MTGMHTPGPWKASEWLVGGGRAVGVSRETVCGRSICTFTAHPATDEDFANARLIAAAPELLVALRSLLLQSLQGRVLERDAIVSQATAAIAKAEGSAAQ